MPLNLPTQGSAPLDKLEAAIAARPQVECPVHHHFADGMYIRETHIPAGVICTGVQHRFTHPFFLIRGKIQFVSETEGAVTYEAPAFGITLKGTRRGAHAITDCVLVTCHVSEETDVEKIGAAIIEPHHNPLLEGVTPQWQNQLTNT